MTIKITDKESMYGSELDGESAKPMQLGVTLSSSPGLCKQTRTDNGQGVSSDGEGLAGERLDFFFAEGLCVDHNCLGCQYGFFWYILGGFWYEWGFGGVQSGGGGFGINGGVSWYSPPAQQQHAHTHTQAHRHKRVRNSVDC